MIETLVARAHEAGAKVGLCGQAPSNNPAFAKLLVKAGIDTISVTPDSFVAVKTQRGGGGKSRELIPAPSGEIETTLPSV
jgi:phosphoenolpyruvate-protein kinase (PTS system EI component)